MSHIHSPLQSVLLRGMLFVSLFIGGGCTTTTNKPFAPLTLDNPVQVRQQTASLAVGKNRWNGQHVQVTELFLPIAVIVRNTGPQPLCGGVATATLSDASGTSTSAIFPEGVVARLIGPLAVLPSREIILPSSGFTPATFRTNEGQFTLMPVWGPGGFGGGFGGFGGGFRGGFGPGFGGGFGPDPFWGSAFPSPFYDPWSPFRRFPYGRPFPPFPQAVPAPQPEETKKPMLQEIFSVAFASRPLASQEERSGFLFFPSPTHTGPLTLTWDWYDCTTHALLAHFTVPISPEPHWRTDKS